MSRNQPHCNSYASLFLKNLGQSHRARCRHKYLYSKSKIVHSAYQEKHGEPASDHKSGHAFLQLKVAMDNSPIQRRSLFIPFLGFRFEIGPVRPTMDPELKLKTATADFLRRASQF
jgi:hypothetical protein